MRVNLAARAAAAEARRAKTRDRLLEAAQRVIAEKGLETASVEDFVAAAGVSRGTFYNYFPSLADLVHALNVHLAAVLASEIDALPPEPDPARDVARRLHRGLAMALQDRVRGWVMLRLVPYGVARQSVLEERFLEAFDRGQAEGRFRDVERRALLTATFGAMRMAQREALTGVMDIAGCIDVVALVLSSYGLPPEEAAVVSRDGAAGVYSARPA